MPRRSGHAQSDENPPPRRQSARIAAVQAASPAKSPVKSPRRKRQSTEPNKSHSEDTESQQSQIKSESSIEGLNGLETSSSKDRESVVDSQELPSKKAKVDEENGGKLSFQYHHLVDTSKEEASAAEAVEPEHEKSSKDEMDFEVVEKSEVPPPDSAEVRAAITVQGEDGQLLAGFVQVDKDGLPSATSLEVKQPCTEEPEASAISLTTSSVHASDALVENSVNGDSNHHLEPAPALEPDVQTKAPVAAEATAQPILAPAAGDGTTDAVVSEPVPQ
ncbi:hypothetical protein FBUS_06263 [Fasciolopsis buskii]|uniref:Uncharacterized protein n=1 Tax=Fasciolopsis buskii TaxID=27845 RepID=A0A8E0RXD0_9TREM|nr:hypothetical protein FBUS_06263 [Fasciolopsis buski]